MLQLLLTIGLDRLVSQGKFGRKSGEGFYVWEGDKVKGVAN